MQIRTARRNDFIAGRAALAVLLFAVWTLPAAAVTVTSQVSANNDDAEERISDGDMDRGSSDLELVFDGGTEQLVGVRFDNVNVPAGVVITNAYIQFTTDETDSGTTNVLIHGQADPDPPQFQNDDFDISSRAATAATVSWNSIPSWNTVGEQGNNQRTPNLATIISELIADPGWAANNAMVFVFGAGSGCISSACQRTAESRNGSNNDAPQLVVEYSTAPPDSADLRISIVDSPDPVDTGKLLQYTLTATNNGPLAATGVTVSGTLPAGVGFVSANPSQGSCTESGGSISCALGDLAVGNNAT
ncbi:MAG: DUF11 domain-containing protein, partial [Gammaproteobacteria bacterium]|nr:DUF11 domain-containing protein [Gammaproteobacteria bacterium]